MSEKSALSRLTTKVSLPTLIIGVFWILTLILGAVSGMSTTTFLTDSLKRFGMNGVLVLAMLPAIQSGTGPNFALPVGIVCGLLAMVCSIEFGFVGLPWLLISFLLAAVLASIAGLLYGRLMNAVKGSEMTIATYTGFSIVAFMSILWLMIPFKSPKMGWFLGEGLRSTIKLDGVEAEQILNKFLGFTIGGDNGIYVPTGMLLVFFLFCSLIWLFFRSKTGAAISAGGASPMFAAASGINVDRYRVIANVLSTVLGAFGIIIYSQSYGYAQLYDAPLREAFPAVAAILIGGATAQRASVSNVIIGTFLFHGLMTTALPVANTFLGADLSEPIRAMIQNGVILYALTRVKGDS